MLNKAFSILSVLFILMLASTFGYADDQLNGEAGINSTAATYSGYIVKLQWYSAKVTQLRMIIKSQQARLDVFVVNSDTKIDINGRLAGPKELAVGDMVKVIADSNKFALTVSVKRPSPGPVVKMNCKIEEIKSSGSNLVFVMESTSGTQYYYELNVTPKSKLYRNGRLADPSEFQINDVGTVRFYIDNLNIVSFIAISPDSN